MGEVVYAIWAPEAPLKAIAGTPSFAASVAAPTVPETRVVEPRFADARKKDGVSYGLIDWIGCLGWVGLVKGIHTSNIKPRNRHIHPPFVVEEPRRQRLNPIPHRGDGVRIDVVEPRVRGVGALGG